MDVVTKGIYAAIPLIERRLGLSGPFSEHNLRHLAFRGLLIASGDSVRMPVDTHIANSREKIDAVLRDAKGEMKAAIEFECHRSYTSGHNRARTKYAGYLLANFARLRDFPYVHDHRFVVYLTDGEMLRYFNNPDNGLDWLFSASEQEISDNNLPNTPTLRKYAGDWNSPVRTQVTGDWEVGNDHKLVVWRVDS